MKRLLFYWLPPLVIMSLTFFLSSRTGLVAAPDHLTDFTLKKIAHFIEYFILAFLLFRALTHTTRLTKTQCLTLSFIWICLYAISDEIHQSFVPTREPRLRDVAIDCVGGLFGLISGRQLYSTTG